jgi:hypothetical protein
VKYKLVARGRYRVAPFLIRKWYVLESEDGRTINVKKVKVYTDEEAERKYAELFPDEA